MNSADKWGEIAFLVFIGAVVGGAFLFAEKKAENEAAALVLKMGR